MPMSIHHSQSSDSGMSSALIHEILHTVDMSRLSPNVRPTILRSNSSSSSLNGMEIAAPKLPNRNRKSKKSGEDNNPKPLPPTPTLKVPSIPSSKTSSITSGRTPSIGSLSSVYDEDYPQTQTYVPFRKESMLLPPKPTYEPSSYRSSTSAVPDVQPSRPEPKRDAKMQASLHKPSIFKIGPPESIFSEWKAPKYDEQGDVEKFRVPVPVEVLAQKSRETQHIAQQHADNYRLLLPRSSSLPVVEPEPNAEPYYDGFNSLPAPMSPRITDVVDGTLVPRPLRMSTALDSRSSSHFSSSSDEAMALRKDGGESMKSRAKKAFHSRKQSQEKSLRKSIDCDKTFHKASDNEERDKVVSMTPSERASIQKGIFDMYDTLTGLYDPLKKYVSSTEPASSPRPKPKIDFPPLKKNVIHKDGQSPAIPLTPHPANGHKAGEEADSPPRTPLPKSAMESWLTYSPTGNTPKKSHFSISSKGSSSDGSRSPLSSADRKKTKTYTFPQRDRSANKKGSKAIKWKKVVGLDKKKGRLSEGEKRRESMKKKIVIVGPVPQGPF